jgi:signal transduction histidine kinase
VANARAARLDASDVVVLRGIGALAWIGVALDIATRLAGKQTVARPWVLTAATVATLVLAAAYSILLRHDEATVTRPAAVGIAVAVAAAASGADGWAFGPAQAFRPPLLASTWVIAAVALAGFAWGIRLGTIVGLLVGLARWAGGRAPDISMQDYFFLRSDYPRLVPIASTMLLYATLAAAAGFLRVRLRDATRDIAAAQTREEVTRAIHDGVLQTLALVERRSADPDVIRLARDQQHRLRGLVTSGTSRTDTDLATALRDAANTFERTYGTPTDVVVAPDLGATPADATHALLGAVGEALVNVGKHASATRVVVYVQPTDDGGVSCTIHDDGAGFDADTVVEGIGLRTSVRGRLQQVGGTVEIRSDTGRGTEVHLWAPRDAGRIRR